MAFRKRADFSRKGGHFARKMTENPGKKAENSQNPGSENGSNSPLQIAAKQE
jgi:hypothetical protein